MYIFYFQNTFDNNSFVMNFLESQINVIGLITEYKKQLLDDGLKGQTKLKEFDNEDYKKLTDQFNIKEHLNLNWQHVKAIIEHLCREYKQYSQSLIQGKEITTNSKASLYFHYLDFLETHKESNIKQIDDHRSSQQVILQIVDVYKEFPNLWNTNLAEYCCKNIRSKALEEMLWHLEMRLNLKISLNSLKKHLRYIHNYFREEKMQRLKNAKAVYKSEAVYKKMFFLAEHVGPFKCSDCQLEIKCPFMLKIHKFGIHGGDMPFTCSVCQKQFRSLNSYVFHARRHMDDINIGCKLCNKKFTHISALKAHMVSHNEEQQRQTSNDNESMTRQKIVRVYSAVSNRKIRTVAANNTQSSTSPTPSNHQECRVCGIVFKMRKSFNQHMKMMHEDNSEET